MKKHIFMIIFSMGIVVSTIHGSELMENKHVLFKIFMRDANSSRRKLVNVYQGMQSGKHFVKAEELQRDFSLKERIKDLQELLTKLQKLEEINQFYPGIPLEQFRVTPHGNYDGKPVTSIDNELYFDVTDAIKNGEIVDFFAEGID